MAAVVAGALLSGAATEWMGLHFIFGAFMFGTIMPTTGTRMMRGYVHARIAELNGVLLLPVFFIVAGLKVDLSAFSTTGLKELGLILAVAMLGKFGGAYVTARLFRMPARQATTLGILMNTRGLTELIVLTVGLELGLIDTRLYTLLVIMAIVTTAMAGPLLWLVYPAAQVRHDTKPREQVDATAGVA
jgi:Kef-type K+ transport system membrane component KefB